MFVSKKHFLTQVMSCFCGCTALLATALSSQEVIAELRLSRQKQKFLQMQLAVRTLQYEDHI